MFERFTMPARGVVLRARTEARELGNPIIGTEHLLLALLHEDAGLPYRVLRQAGVDADSVRAQVRRMVPSPLLGPEDAAALRTIGIELDAVLARIEETFGPDALGVGGLGAGGLGAGGLGASEPARPAHSARRLFGRRRRRPVGQFAPRSKKVLELSLREALRLGHRYIGTEHILLGLIREGEGMAAKILTDGGVDLPGLRRALEAELRQAA